MQYQNLKKKKLIIKEDKNKFWQFREVLLLVSVDIDQAFYFQEKNY